MLRRATPALFALLLSLIGCEGSEDIDAKTQDSGGAGADGADGADGAGGADGADGADGAADGGDGGSVAVYGPENAWWHAPADSVPAGLSGGSHRVGETLGNFTLTDQNGDQVELYQFYGKVVQLVLFAEWCGPCNAEAPEIEAAAADLLDEDIVVISVMVQQNDGSAPDGAALGRWVDRYSVTHPLLAGTSELEAMLQGGFPTLPVADSSMTIVTLDNFPFDPEYLRGVE
ncbi:MAG: redoxin domain-containing protein [Deltaproteobacteria bacterium]|nr:redoxin domain-containing protein [Deltaproteobacteria bacterium]